MAVTIQLRHDTAANWTSANPVLAVGEAGVEVDTQKLKLGNGTTPWAGLSYISGGGGGGGGGALVVAENSTVIAAAATTLNYGSGFDVAESPTGQANVTMDLSEYSSSALPVGGGGTGSTTAGGALANLSAQPLDSDLTAIAALAPANDTVIQRKAGAWVASAPATVKTDMSLAKGDVGLGNVDNTADAAKPVSSATTTALTAKVTNGGGVDTILALSQAAYDALGVKSSTTLYVIV